MRRVPARESKTRNHHEPAVLPASCPKKEQTGSGSGFGSGFDTLMSEGFQYDGINHNLDQAKRCAAYPFAEL